MILTRFGLAVLLIGPLLTVLSVFVPASAGLGDAGIEAAPSLMLWWISVVVLVATVDNVLSRRLSRVEVRRIVDDKLSLGIENQVAIELYSRSRAVLHLLVKDDPPVEFDTSRRQHRLRLIPYETRRVYYDTVPRARGDYEFGDIHLRGRSLLALSWWQRRVPAEQSVKVYPNLLQVRGYELLAHSDRLHQVGFRLLRRLGEGTDFESLRDYLPDDDFKHIDWKASARRQKPITRQYQIERSQNLILMIDAGRMMCAQLEDMSKLDYAINAALMLGYVATRQDDAVGLVVFADTVQSFVPPRKGPAQIGRLVDQLYAVQPTIQEPDYGAALSLLHSRARKRALVVIFTDIIDREASRQLLAHAAALFPHHLPLVVTIRDPRLEGTANLVPSDAAQVYERAVAAGLLRDRQQALTALRQRGARVVDAVPSQLTVAAVNRYLDIKARQLL